MATMSFFFRPSSRGKEYVGSLNLRFIHQRKIKQIKTSFDLYPEEWDSSLQKVIYSIPDRKEYIRKVEGYMQQSEQLFRQATLYLESTAASYSLEEIVSFFEVQTPDDSLRGFVRGLCSELIRYGQDRTARAYQSVVSGLIEFNKGEELQLVQLDGFFIRSYERYMKEKGKTPNTISFYMRNLRAIYNKAVQKGLLENKSENLFKDVYTGVDKTRKRALSREEILRLHNLKFSEQLFKNKSGYLSNMEDVSLYKAWRLFFFCFHARGMCFVDMAYLRKDNISGNLIRYYRKKTGQLIEVKITSRLQAIIDSFADDVKDSPYLFPVIRHGDKSKRLSYESGLRQQNRCLKLLASKAEINKSLSTHVSRHSWATLAKRENLPIWVISESLGHNNEKTTYTYLASLDRSALDRANDIVSATIESGFRKRMHRVG